MATLQAEQMADMVATTLRDLGKPNFTAIATDMQDYVAMRTLMKKNKIVFGSGYGHQFDLMTDHNHSAEFVGLFATDNVNVPNVMIQGNVPWRHFKFDFAFDEHELTMNRSSSRIVDLMLTRRLGAFIAGTEKLENRFWRSAAVTDNLNPYGVPYWIVKNASEGFNGSVPATHTTVAGINPTTYSRWKNYTAQYTAITKDDLVRKLRRGATMTNFKPPVDSPSIPDFNTGDRYGFYTTYDVISAMEEILEAQNDDLGNDVASMDGKVMFRRSPFVRVPALEDDTTDPIYMINWGVFKTVVLGGWWMKETVVSKVGGQHLVTSTFYDSSLNFLCYDRRRCGVFATGTTMPA
jgi:hypothetical protein